MMVSKVNYPKMALFQVCGDIYIYIYIYIFNLNMIIMVTELVCTLAWDIEEIYHLLSEAN